MTAETVDLETRAALLDALVRFTLAIDSADYPGCAEVFTSDCATDYGERAGGRIVGRSAFVERLRVSQGRFLRTHHQLGQTGFAVSDGVITTITYVTASHRRLDGTLYVSQLQYHDTWTQEPDGWRISERRALFALVIDPASDEEPQGANWVSRDG